MAGVRRPTRHVRAPPKSDTAVSAVTLYFGTGYIRTSIKYSPATPSSPFQISLRSNLGKTTGREQTY